MMDVREFTKKLGDEVRDRLPDETAEGLDIRDAEIVKMNDLRLHALIFRKEGEDAAPTHYIDDLYEMYKSGVPVAQLACTLADRYIGSSDMRSPKDADLSYDAVRERLTVRLLEIERNSGFLADKPHLDMGNGLVLTADIDMSDDCDCWRTAVTDAVLGITGADRETLLGEAVSNSAVIDPPKLRELSDAIFDPCGCNLLDGAPEDPKESGEIMYVLSNSSGMNGAAALFYPGIMSRSAEVIGSDYYVLPSSIHEVILVPDTGLIKEEALCEMVREANRSVVEAKDVLSDRVFRYSRETGELSEVS